MHWLDITILVILGLTLGLGVWRGFIHEVMAILAWIFAFVAARLLAPHVAVWLDDYIEQQAIILVLAWLIPFLATFIIMNIIRYMIKTMITMVGLRPVDRLFGGVFGLLKGSLIITALTLVTQLATSQPATTKIPESKFLPYFQTLSTWLVDNLQTARNLDFSRLMEQGSRFEKLVSEAALNLGLDRDQVQQLLVKLDIDSQELLSRLQDPQQLEKLRALIEDPQFLRDLNTN